VRDDPVYTDILDPHRHQIITNLEQALITDGWDTDPFKLTIDKQSGRLIGRGSSDDKGPLLGWINVLEAHVKQGIELPVNLKLCFEGADLSWIRRGNPSGANPAMPGMEESGSEGLDELIQREVGPGKFFDGVDCVCIVSCQPSMWLLTEHLHHPNV
jgi:Cys-Gly metallodipeptidase DUG1